MTDLRAMGAVGLIDRYGEIMFDHGLAGRERLELLRRLTEAERLRAVVEAARKILSDLNGKEVWWQPDLGDVYALHDALTALDSEPTR